MRPEARIQAVIEYLSIAFEQTQKPADLCLHHYFRARRYIGSQDRRAIRDMAFAIMRHYNGYTFNLPPSLTIPEQARLCVFQHLIQHDAYTIHDVQTLCSGQGYAPLPLSPPELTLLTKSIAPPHSGQDIKCFLPQWLLSSLESDYDTPTIKEIARSFLHAASVDLRVNIQQSTRDHVSQHLLSEGIITEKTPYSPWGLRLQTRTSFIQHPLYQKGHLEIQDEGSQLLAHLTDARPGMIVWDYCAGAGGKTLALAAHMQQQGQIIATDIDSQRLQRAQERFKRAQLQGILCHTLKSPNTALDKYMNRCDRVLVDAPCSGSGTWRRNPDLRWRFTPENLMDMVTKQQDILQQAAQQVRPGGRLIYATCSILPQENIQQVTLFQERNSGFTMIPLEPIWYETGLSSLYPTSTPWLQLLPHRHHTDGFFIAVLQKNL